MALKIRPAEERQEVVARIPSRSPPPTVWNQRGRKMIAAEEAERGEEHRGDRDRERPDPEQVERDDRLGHARLDPHEHAPPNASPTRISPPTAGSVHSPVCLLVRPMRNGAIASGEDGRAEVVDVAGRVRVA